MQLAGSARCRVKDLNPVCNTLVASLTFSEPDIELTQATAQGGQAAGVSPIEGFRSAASVILKYRCSRNPGRETVARAYVARAYDGVPAWPP